MSGDIASAANLAFSRRLMVISWVAGGIDAEFRSRPSPISTSQILRNVAESANSKYSNTIVQWSGVCTSGVIGS
jgi:hypothetical protein